MSKIKILPKVFALIMSGVTLCSISGCKKEKKYTDVKTSTSIEKAYDVIDTKEYLSNDLMNLVNSQNVGLKDYINKFTNFSNSYVSYDSIEDFSYYSNLSFNQRKIIYEFAYNYSEYLKYFNSKDIENSRKYIIRMINKIREFGNINSILYETFNIGENYLNNVLPLIPSIDYSDYISLLNNSSNLSINYLNGDVIDEELSKFILFLHLYAKYYLDPLQVIQSDKIYLANQNDFDEYLINNKDNFNKDNLFSNFSLEFKCNRWFLKSNNSIFKILKSNSLIAYINDLSKNYQKSTFSYSQMLEYGILEMVLYDEQVFEYNNFDQLNDIEEYWWPIGSSDVDIIDGIEYADGQPTKTFKTNGYNYFNGSSGTNIIASKSGIVIYPNSKEQIYYHINNRGGKHGNCVIIKHFDGNYTMYSHLSYDSITVMYGDYVNQGQLIGKMGKTGDALDVYLEFDIIKDNNKENIFDYINQDEPRKEVVSLKKIK